MTRILADKIFLSNNVYTGLQATPEAAAIAVADHKIIAVDTKENIKAYQGPETDIYDWQDQLIIPGLHDSHTHMMLGSVYLNSVDLSAARSEEEAVSLVKAFAENNPDEEWIIGFQWFEPNWDKQSFPSRHTLDAAIADRPVFLLHLEGHHAWVNSKALEVAHITADTENPSYGEILRDQEGAPTGILAEHAVGLVSDLAFDLHTEKKKSLFQHFLQTANKYGITSVNDLYGESMFRKLDDFPLLKQLESDNELTVRLHLFPNLATIEDAKSMRTTYDSDTLRIAGLKQFTDGVITGYTAHLVEPYTDNPGVNAEPTHDEATFTKWIIEAEKAGFNVRLHACGDGGVRLALNAFENAKQENKITDTRHAIEHIEVIHADDIERFQSLQVIASVQPNHFPASDSALYETKLGQTRAGLFFPNSQLKEAGATFTFGTDFPIDDLNPFAQIHRAVTRDDKSSKPFTIHEALQAYTNAGAYGSSFDEKIGTIETGKFADLTILDRNLFEVEADDILQTKVLLTMMDGKIVYEK